MLNRILLIVTLFAMLAYSIYVAIEGWLSLEGVTLSYWGNVALIAGVLLSLIIGCGLMALAFYSHKSGHDEAVDDGFDKINHNRH